MRNGLDLWSLASVSVDDLTCFATGALQNARDIDVKRRTIHAVTGD
jgi:hypothetical protein